MYLKIKRDLEDRNDLSPVQGFVVLVIYQENLDFHGATKHIRELANIWFTCAAEFRAVGVNAFSLRMDGVTAAEEKNRWYKKLPYYLNKTSFVFSRLRNK